MPPVRSRHRWVANHTDELVGEVTCSVNSDVDSPRKVREVTILRADDDARVVRVDPMELNEVPAVDGQHTAVGLDGESEDGGVFDALIRFPNIVCGEHVMSHKAEMSHHSDREILIGIETCHLTPQVRSPESPVRSPAGAWRRSAKR